MFQSGLGADSKWEQLYRFVVHAYFLIKNNHIFYFKYQGNKKYFFLLFLAVE